MQSGGGNGLGLSFCYNMCRLLNGKLVVYSKPNVGSTFTIKIPLKAKHHNSIARFNSSVSSVDHFDQKILLIDDDIIHLLICKKIFKDKLNVKIVDKAINSSQALELINKTEYDIICIDLNVLYILLIYIYIRNRNLIVKIFGITGSGEKEEHMEFLNGIIYYYYY